MFVGVVDNLEVDFLAIRSGEERLYIHVAHSTEHEETLKREIRPLELIKDTDAFSREANYPKLILTMDTVLPEQNFGGIQKTNALNWLIKE